MPLTVQSNTMKNLCHDHEIEIIVGDESHEEFFFQLEAETTWDSLPLDKRNISRDEFHERLKQTHHEMLALPGHVIFIAVDKNTGDKMGLLWFGPRFNALSCEEEAWIYNLTVLSEYRGRGVGKILMRHAETHAQSQNYDSIGLMVSSHNLGARSLYEKMEYSESNILMRKVLPLDVE
jgi:GNAT superfamily N-acetyltransferase